jgi:methylglutaconyl-CoA hydratase
MNTDGNEVPTHSGHVRLETADGIATVTFAHPKGNSLPGALLRRLAVQIHSAGQDPGARVIVLQSEGGGPFCAGASFDELVAVHDAAAGKAFFGGFGGVILAMIRAPKFVITRIHGKVVGGGVGMVAASDFACAVEAAPSRLSELAIGIGPFVVGLPIERKIGLAAFSAMTLDADWRDAAWCERHGLYSRLFSDEKALDQGVDELARRLAAFNPDAMRRLKEVFWAGTEAWERQLDERADISGELVLSEFTRSAIERFRAR